MVGAALAALIAGAVALILVTVERGSALPQLPADSPEGTVQRYVLALEQQDLDTAYSYFSEAVADEISEREFISGSTLGFVPGFAVTERRIWVGSVERGDDAASVDVIVEESFGGFGMFGPPAEFTYERRLRLVSEDGEWKIDQALYGLDPAQPAFNDPFVD